LQFSKRLHDVFLTSFRPRFIQVAWDVFLYPKKGFVFLLVHLSSLNTWFVWFSKFIFNPIFIWLCHCFGFFTLLTGIVLLDKILSLILFILLIFFSCYILCCLLNYCASSIWIKSSPLVFRISFWQIIRFFLILLVIFQNNFLLFIYLFLNLSVSSKIIIWNRFL